MVEALNGTPVISMAIEKGGDYPSPSKPPVGGDSTTKIANDNNPQQDANVNGVATKSSGSGSQTNANEKDDYTEEDLKKLSEEMNEKLYQLNHEVQFKVDKRINQSYISVIDKKTKEVLREYPPQESRDLIRRLREYEGLLKSGQHPAKHLLVNVKA